MANVMLFSVIDVFADKKAQEKGIIFVVVCRVFAQDVEK